MNFWSKYQWVIVGVLGTLVIHLIVMLFISYKSLQRVAVVNTVVIDFSEEIDPTLEKPKNEPVEDQSGNPLTNVAADVNSETQYSNKLNKNELAKEVDKMVSDLESQYELEATKTKKALKELDDQRREREEKNMLYDAKSKNVDASVGTDGLNATAEWSLKGRKNYSLPLPSYVCKAMGRVRINIKVNRQGEVISATVDENRTNTDNNCLRENAMVYALRSHFNDDFSAVSNQKGWIEFSYARQ